MLEVISLEDARALVLTRFSQFNGVESAACTDAQAGAREQAGHLNGKPRTEVETATVPLDQACGQTIACDVVSAEGIPPFDRSTVDGYAVVAADTFGCSEALPALLALAGEIDMGAEPPCTCTPGLCLRIPTGGEVPQGADAVVMLEHCEDYGDGTIGVASPVAPGDNIVFRNDDVKPGEVLIDSGTVLLPHHIGTLASLGIAECPVRPPLREGAGESPAGWPLHVAIVSTGDEIVPVEQTPVASQMRDVNAPMLDAAVRACGAVPMRYPIVPDDYDALLACVREALGACDMVLVSGGSSAGQKDNTAHVLRTVGELLFHGIAVKPGKPTMCADANGTPVFGLPGHPMAAYFLFLELVKPLIAGTAANPAAPLEAAVAESIPSNHGRAELVPVRLELRDSGMTAIPIRSKSGLISQLSRADGYIVIGRNQEGLAAGTHVDVHPFA